MDVKSCKKCRRLYNYIGGPNICPVCREELENKFQEVKKFLLENKSATISQVAQECCIDERQIREWIREERLEFTSGIDASIVCENCGEPITSGKYCDKCKNSLLSDLNSVNRKEQPKEQIKKTTHENKMRFINTR